uniref:SDG931 n=1 Tax=Arundo donax TaxID=35708 RepID=A0A0A9R8T3_ARUDO
MSGSPVLLSLILIFQFFFLEPVCFSHSFRLIILSLQDLHSHSIMCFSGTYSASIPLQQTGVLSVIFSLEVLAHSELLEAFSCSFAGAVLSFDLQSGQK